MIGTQRGNEVKVIVNDNPQYHNHKRNWVASKNQVQEPYLFDRPLDRSFQHVTVVVHGDVQLGWVWAETTSTISVAIKHWTSRNTCDRTAKERWKLRRHKKKTYDESSQDGKSMIWEASQTINRESYNTQKHVAHKTLSIDIANRFSKKKNEIDPNARPLKYFFVASDARFAIVMRVLMEKC